MAKVEIKGKRLKTIVDEILLVSKKEAQKKRRQFKRTNTNLSVIIEKVIAS